MASTTDVVLFLVLSLAVLTTVRILVFVINRTVRLQRFSAEITNGLKVLIRIFGFVAIILLIFIFFDLSTEALISISSVGGIFIGFASSEVMAQIVSGLYLISARPFGIHDFVKIDDVTGMVMEISMNYTILQKIDGNIIKIPNKTILDSNIKNYTIRLPEEMKKRQAHLSRSEKINLRYVNPEGARKGKIDWKKLRLILDDLTDFAFEKEITRFILEFSLDFSIPPNVVKEKLQRICEKYEAVFEYMPQFVLVSMDFRVEFQMIIYCYSPFVIIHNYDSLLSDIAQIMYPEGEK